MALMSTTVVRRNQNTLIRHFRAQGTDRRDGGVVQVNERGFAHERHFAASSDAVSEES